HAQPGRVRAEAATARVAWAFVSVQRRKSHARYGPHSVRDGKDRIRVCRGAPVQADGIPQLRVDAPGSGGNRQRRVLCPPPPPPPTKGRGAGFLYWGWARGSPPLPPL